MKVRSLVLVGAIAAAIVGSFSSANATHSADPRTCKQSTEFPHRQVTKLPQASGAVLYLDDRQKTADPNPGLVDGGNGTWLFAETNGKPGLQTGGIHAAFDPIDEVELADETGWHDKNYCNENGTAYTSGKPDAIIF